MGKTIVILGFGCYSDTMSILDALIDKKDKNTEIWAMNSWRIVYPNLKHPDKVFHIHSWLSSKDKDDIIEVYNNSGAEIVTIKPFEKLKNNRVIDIKKYVDIWTEDFFASTCNHCFAMAVDEKPDKIVLLGVQMLAYNELDYQLPAMRYGIWKARESGIEVWAQFEEQWKRVKPESDVRELPKLKAPYIFTPEGLQRWRDAGLSVWENPDEAKEI